VLSRKLIHRTKNNSYIKHPLKPRAELSLSQLHCSSTATTPAQSEHPLAIPALSSIDSPGAWGCIGLPAGPSSGTPAGARGVGGLPRGRERRWRWLTVHWAAMAALSNGEQLCGRRGLRRARSKVPCIFLLLFFLFFLLFRCRK